MDEYAEVFEDYFDHATSESLLEFIEVLPNVQQVKKYFFLQLIPQDEDDEKYVDCAFAAGAEYLVSNDRHFRHLKNADYPPFRVLDEDEFREIFEKRFGSKK